MGFVKCFDAVTMVTDEATKQFGSTLRESVGKKQELGMLCELMDSLAEQSGGIAYETEVNDETTDISLTLTCSEFTADDSSSFYELVNRAKSVGFKNSGNDMIDVTFVFNGIWDRNEA